MSKIVPAAVMGSTEAGSGALSFVEAALGADVAMTDADTWYDGPSVALSAGTWLLVGHVLYDGNGNANRVVGKLWDGTTYDR